MIMSTKLKIITWFLEDRFVADRMVGADSEEKACRHAVCSLAPLWHWCFLFLAFKPAFVCQWGCNRQKQEPKLHQRQKQEPNKDLQWAPCSLQVSSDGAVLYLQTCSFSYVFETCFQFLVFLVCLFCWSSDMLWNCTLPIQFVAEPCQCQNDSQAGTAVPAQYAFQLAFLQLIIFTLLACVASFIFKFLQELSSSLCIWSCVVSGLQAGPSTWKLQCKWQYRCHVAKPDLVTNAANSSRICTACWYSMPSEILQKARLPERGPQLHCLQQILGGLGQFDTHGEEPPSPVLLPGELPKARWIWCSWSSVEHFWPECVLSALLWSPGVHGLKFPCCMSIGAFDAGSWHGQCYTAHHANCQHPILLLTRNKKSFW